MNRDRGGTRGMLREVRRLLREMDASLEELGDG